MAFSQTDEQSLRAVRSLQIIVGGLIFGAVFFVFVALFTFGRHGNTTLSADTAAGAQTILTHDHVPVGTRIAIGSGSGTEEIRTVGGAEPVAGTAQHRITVTRVLQSAHGRDELVRRHQRTGSPLVAYAILVLTGADLILWALIPAAIVRAARRRHSENLDAALPLTYQTRTLVAAALIEGAVFFNVVAYLVTHLPISLVTAAGLILLLTAHFPTCGRVSTWMNTQKELASQGT